MPMLDAETFADAWKANGYLPGMPSPDEWEAAGNKMATGEILQRLWQTVELLAVHNAELLERIKALEATGGAATKA